MSSGPSPAIHNFPSGVDTYFSVVDRFTIISGESHIVPIGSPYTYYLGHLPLQGAVPGISIPPYVETSGTPSAGTFNVTYSGTNAGLITWNVAQAGVSGNATYQTAGDIVKSVMLNDLSTSITSVESYVLATVPASGSFVRTSGGTMTGNLTMNGASIATTVSGGNNMGAAGLPFASIYANGFFGQSLQSDTSNYVQFNASGLKQKANTIRLEGGTDIFLTTSGSTIYLYATTISVSGNIIPTFTGFYNLGSPSKHFATLYVDNIVTPNGSGTFVHTSGDTMTGNLTMNGAAIVTDQINSNTGAVTINGNPVNITSAGSINLTPAAFGQVNLGTALNVSNTSVSTSATITPTSPSTFDLGASGNTFRRIYVDTIIGGSLSGSFVKTSGDTMTGSLTLQPPAALNVSNINSVFGSGVAINAPTVNINAASDFMVTIGLVNKFEVGTGQIYHSASIIPTVSGTYDIGTASRTISTIYADNIKGGQISNTTISNPTFSGSVTLSSGSSIIAGGSGSITIGSPSSPISIIYADSIITAATSGTYVAKTGDQMTGNLTFASGAGVRVTTSGTSDIGTAALPMGTVYANSIVTSSGGAIFVLKAGDTMTGPLLLSDVRTLSGNLGLSGTVNTNIIASQNINLTAQSINIKSTAGPTIINSNSETQFLINGASGVSINPSGVIMNTSMLPATSGTYTLGTPSFPFNTIYAKNIVGIQVSGNYVVRTGDSMTGSLTMVSGANILTGNSGVNTIGASGVPFQTIYVDNINGTPFNSLISGTFVHISGDTMTGNLTIFSGSQINVSTISGNNAFSGLSIVSTSGGSVSYVTSRYSGVSLSSVMGINNANISVGDAGNSGPLIGLSAVAGGGGSSFRQVLNSTGVQFSGASTTFRADIGTPFVVGGNSSFIITPTGLLLLNQGTNMLNVSNDATLGIATSGNISTATSGTYNIGSPSLPFNIIYANSLVGASGNLGYVHISGDTMTGTLSVPTISGTLISGGSIYAPLIFGQQSQFNSITPGITSNSIIIGNSGATPGRIAIQAASTPFGSIDLSSQTSTPQISISGSAFYLYSGINILNLNSGINNLGSPSGTFNFAYVDNVVAKSATISGNAVIVSGVSLGVGKAIFDSKLGNNLQFNSISGAGSVVVSLAANLLTISGSASGGGGSTITTPASTTSSGIAIWSGTAGGGFLDTSITIVNGGTTLLAPTISGNTISGITIISNSVSGATFTVATSILPTTSGSAILGSSAAPFSGVSSNNYTTTRVSGTITSATQTIMWTSGASQILGWTNGQPSGVSILFSGMTAGSSYVLETLNNASGTGAITWPAGIKWQNFASGTMTASGNSNDLFTFYAKDSTTALGNSSLNYR